VSKKLNFIDDLVDRFGETTVLIGLIFFCLMLLGFETITKYMFFPYDLDTITEIVIKVIFTSLLAFVTGSLLRKNYLLFKRLNLMDAITLKKKSGGIFMCLFIVFIFFSLDLLDYFSSAIFPAAEYTVFVNKKDFSTDTNGTHYDVTLTSWLKDNNQFVEISMPRRYWNKIAEGKPARIKVKQGFFSPIIWEIKQQ
jgi:hypothetical protein